MQQQEYTGKGSISNLGTILTSFNARNVFLVSGGMSFAGSGAKEILAGILADHRVTFFSEFESNPRIEDLRRGIRLFGGGDHDIVLAVGGGSVIDMAKMINFFTANRIDPQWYISGRPVKGVRGKPFVAVPTTAGSGSETTHFAVLYIDHSKYSVAHEFIMPDVAVVDPLLTMSMPAGVAASTGLDALCQGIESYWCVNSTDGSKEFAREAIQLVMANLGRSVNDPDERSRMAMARAAHLAGKAINITRTTAPHAVSYPLTSYFGIPHGHAAALTLSSFLAFNAHVREDDVLDPRGVDYVRRTIDELAGILNAADITEARDRIDRLIHAVGLSASLKELGVENKEQVDLIIKNGFNPDRVKNNPRKLTERALREILSGLIQFSPAAALRM